MKVTPGGTSLPFVFIYTYAQKNFFLSQQKIIGKDILSKSIKFFQDSHSLA